MQEERKTEGVAEELEREKRASWAQLLIKSARLLDERLVAQLAEERGYAGLRRAHMALLPHLDLEGTRLTVLAERVGVSKQAIGQLVDELEAMGVVERVADPSDGRAKRVRFVRGGEEVLEGVRWLREQELALERGLDEGDGARLRGLLERLLGVLEGE